MYSIVKKTSKNLNLQFVQIQFPVAALWDNRRLKILCYPSVLPFLPESTSKPRSKIQNKDCLTHFIIA